MEDWISQTTILKMIAVLFVLIVVFKRSGIGKIQWILSMSVLAATSALRYFNDGYHGILFSLAGAAAAFIFTLPLYKLKRIASADLVASCTVGVIIGPAGYSIAFLIAFMLFMLQHFLKANSSAIPVRFTHFASFYGPDLINEENRSEITDGAAGTALHGGGNESPLIGSPDRTRDRNMNDPAAQRVENILPWRGKLALATLTALMIGIPL